MNKESNDLLNENEIQTNLTNNEFIENNSIKIVEQFVSDDSSNDSLVLKIDETVNRTDKRQQILEDSDEEIVVMPKKRKHLIIDDD